ncbi:MAG: glycosyltransferase, partial [Candidatus Eisenbacteria bacterium]|nr:glycosyltransferase [Candidatus Eisenbacteria bacterium]
MRVLILNAFHYPRGGVERVVFDETRGLAAAGHEVAHFAIQDPRNLESPTAKFFAPPADFGENAPLSRSLAQLPRTIWSKPAADALDRLLGVWHPDVAHVHAPSRYLTPAPMRSLERQSVPMVMTLHDFKPWCTNRVMFARGEPCQRCKGGAHWHAAVVGCVQNSHAKSLLGALEAYVHDARGAYGGVRHWIAPSRFARERGLAHGLPNERVSVIPHGVGPAHATRGAAAANATGAAGVVAAPVPPREPFVLFAGRLSSEKGVDLLPAIAAAIAPAPLIVAGEGPLHATLAAAAG